MIYIISFLEALAGGLNSVNLALYLKNILQLNHYESAKILSGLSVLSSVLIFLCGRLVDKLGVKRSALAGATLLTVGRAVLGVTTWLPLALFAFGVNAFGSAIKSSSVLVFIRKNKLSYKLDYVVFNLAFCTAGVVFDLVKHNPTVYLLSSAITALNVLAVLFLPYDKPSTPIEKGIALDKATLRLVLIYNSIMVPVSCCFAFMSNFIPKAALHILGPDAPVGKLAESLNPALILITVPIFSYFHKRLNWAAMYVAIGGTLLSAGSLMIGFLPLNYLTLTIIIISLFTIGEAIWSPASMELSTTMCPPGSEGKYMTISLIPRTLGNLFMSYFSAYNFEHFIYIANPKPGIPYLLMGLVALLTPISLIIFGKQELSKLSTN